MSDIELKGELRTDMDCEVSGLPAKRWAEMVLKVGDEEVVVEISLEEKPMLAVMAGEEAVWKGSLEGFKLLLRGEILGR